MKSRAPAAPLVSLRALPNTLSSLRIVLAVLLPTLDERWWLPVVLGAGVTDWLDGLLARRWGVTSWMGGLLDGLADKLFVFSALLVLAGDGRIPVAWVPLLLARDLIVALGTAIALVRRNHRALRNLGSRLFGKLTTILVFVLFVFVLVRPDGGLALRALIALASASSVAAAVDYARVRVRDLLATRSGGNP